MQASEFCSVFFLLTIILYLYLSGNTSTSNVIYFYFLVNIMSQWKGSNYVGVDPWELDIVPNYLDGVNSIGKNRSADLLMTINQLSKYGDKITLLRTFGSVVVDIFKDQSVDTVFIDAIHNYYSVMEVKHIITS